MKDFSIAYNTKNGNYYIYHKNDIDKWGLEKERVIYQSPLGYFYKIGRREVYLTDEESEALDKFRNEVTK